MINNIEEYKKTLDEYKSIVGPTSESNEIKQDLIEYVEVLEEYKSQMERYIKQKEKA